MKADEILGKDAENKTWAHAYLFIGCDKTAEAEVRQKILSFRHYLIADVSEIQKSEESGKRGEIKVDAIRRLIHEISLSPHGDGRVAFIYSADSLNIASANLLLKTLEEPPGKAMLVLFAETEKILPTIKSRCRVVRVPSARASADLNLGFTKETFLEISKEVDKVIKDGQIEDLLDQLELDLRESMIREKSIRAVKLIKKLEIIRKDIRNNANPKLALESLILMIRELK